MDTGLDENKTELGVLILAVTLKVLADSDSLRIMLVLKYTHRSKTTYLLDQHVQVLWDFWGEACFVTPSV